jgi:hypothetical protein
MRHRKDSPDASTTTDRTNTRSGLGPFSGGQITTIICVTVVAALVGLPMVASAVIPNGNAYNACYKKAGGALRLIDKSKGQKCNATENAVSWSKQGPRGATGPGGANGAPGSARAYAYVRADGTVVAARTKNIAVKRVATLFGLHDVYYCIDAQGGIDGARIAPVVSPDGAEREASLLFNSQSVATYCGTGYDFFVRIADSDGSNVFNTPFTVVVP